MANQPVPGLAEYVKESSKIIQGSKLLSTPKKLGKVQIIYDDISVGGCETCDYGSSYGFAIRIWE